MNAIALAAHPSNKDASAHAVRDIHFGHGIATIFKVEAGYVPALKGMTAPGHFTDQADAIEWVELFATELFNNTRRRRAIDAFNAAADARKGNA